MNQFKMLKPEEAARRAKEKVAAFKKEGEMKAAEAKRRPEPAVEKPFGEPATYIVGMMLLQACNAGDKEWVERILKAGADANAENMHGQTALMIAAERGHTEIVELLKSHGAKE